MGDAVWGLMRMGGSYAMSGWCVWEMVGIGGNAHSRGVHGNGAHGRTMQMGGCCAWGGGVMGDGAHGSGAHGVVYAWGGGAHGRMVDGGNFTSAMRVRFR